MSKTATNFNVHGRTDNVLGTALEKSLVRQTLTAYQQIINYYLESPLE